MSDIDDLNDAMKTQPIGGPAPIGFIPTHCITFGYNEYGQLLEYKTDLRTNITVATPFEFPVSEVLKLVDIFLK